ncbi:MAG: response regulator [Polyangiaceae bacterium]
MSSDSRAILVVEDEDALRLSMVRGLSKVAGVVVHGAASLGEARVLLRSIKPALVVSDLDLPDGLGISLAVEMEHIGLRSPIVFVSAYVRKFHQRLAGGNFEVYEKPVSLDRLREIALEKIGDGAMAPPSPFGVADFVQLAGMGRSPSSSRRTVSRGEGT